MIAVYETDVQYDFCSPDGNLYVPDSEKDLDNIIKIHEHAKVSGWKIFGSVDKHYSFDDELIRNGGLFPDHCMEGSDGQRRIKELNPENDFYIENSENGFFNVYDTCYQILSNDLGRNIIFEKQSVDVGDNVNFRHVMRMCSVFGIDRIIVNGFATEYCVKAFIESLLEMVEMAGYFNIAIALVTDAIRAVSVSDGENAIEELSESVVLLDTSEVIKCLML
jgi:nicotinamidase/pyrazinamidase